MSPPEATIDLDTMRASAAEACRLMKVLSNPDRLLLLCQLAQGERCPSDLEAELGIVQPTLSQQLGVLRDEGLVETRKEGRFVHYRIASAEAAELLGVLYRQFCAPAPAGRRAPRRSLQEK